MDSAVDFLALGVVVAVLGIVLIYALIDNDL
jgi:hypothetical protein